MVNCDAVYEERNRVVAGLARLALDGGGDAWRAPHDPDDGSWDPEWRTIIFIVLPGGAQLSWHIHDRERGLFAFLRDGPNAWDGHTTPEKYERLERFAKRP